MMGRLGLRRRRRHLEICFFSSEQHRRSALAHSTFTSTNISPLVCLTKFIWSKRRLKSDKLCSFLPRRVVGLTFQRRRTLLCTLSLHFTRLHSAHACSSSLHNFAMKLHKCTTIQSFLWNTNWSNHQLCKPKCPVLGPTILFWPDISSIELHISFLWYHHDKRKLLVLKLLQYKNLSLWHFDTLGPWDLSPQDPKTLRPWALKTLLRLKTLDTPFKFWTTPHFWGVFSCAQACSGQCGAG